jgi:biopolymer transport protein ExbB/TolQ
MINSIISNLESLIIPILLVFWILVIAVFIDKLGFWVSMEWRHRRVRKLLGSLSLRLVKSARESKEEVLTFVPNPWRHMLHYPSQKEEVLNCQSQEAMRWEAVIGFIQQAAPMLGLFGTICGLILSFQGLDKGFGADLNQISNGVSIALNSTALALPSAIAATLLLWLQQAWSRRWVARLEMDLQPFRVKSAMVVKKR